MSDDKKVVVQELRFGGMMHIPPMNVLHKLLKELAYSFDMYNNTLNTRYGIIKITQENIAATLDLTVSRPGYPVKVNFQELSQQSKEVIRNFQGKTLSELTTSIIEMSGGGEKNRLKFKRIFILYIQMCFL
ncbi:uncharacterized protein DS421_14g466420 [Arachis hypogaea]|nr:uncharacterized protein DS421_14g466420 [Arachis hypogaea]